MLYFFVFKQKTAYEMRISDGSSDVCSSDLGLEVVEGPPCRCLDKRIGARLQVEESIERTFDQRVREALKLEDRPFGEIDVEQAQQRLMDMREHIGKIGRASCRKRVVQCV